jgi:hypothetical protein
MKIRQFVRCAKTMPIGQSVLLRGNTGIGKSQCVFQLAEHFGLEVVERRLSQCSEGDLLGLPLIENGATNFQPPGWYLDCCKSPKVLFLDEINRATNEVMNAAFQIVLDRELAGWKLHPETRVYAAINIGAEYQVNQMDPALLDRFWVCDLDPDVDEWLEWAKTDKAQIHPVVIDFIQAYRNNLDGGKRADADSVTPSRRSWHKFSNILNHANVKDWSSPEVYELALGLVGAEVASAFSGHVKALNRNVTAEEILEDFDKVEKLFKNLGQDKWNYSIDSMNTWMEKNTFDLSQAVNFVKFFLSLPNDLALVQYEKSIEKGAKDQRTIDNLQMYYCDKVAEKLLSCFGEKLPEDSDLPTLQEKIDELAKQAKEKGGEEPAVEKETKKSKPKKK